MTAEQISLRDAAYYQEHMIEFLLNKEVILITDCFRFYLLHIHYIQYGFIFTLPSNFCCGD